MGIILPGPQCGLSGQNEIAARKNLKVPLKLAMGEAYKGHFGQSVPVEFYAGVHKDGRSESAISIVLFHPTARASSRRESSPNALALRNGVPAIDFSTEM